MNEYEVNKPKMSQEERDKLMKEFLSKGGKVEKLKPGYPKLGVGSLDKSRKPRVTKHEFESGKTRGDYVPDQVFQKPGTYHDLDLPEDKIPTYVPTKKEDL